MKSTFEKPPIYVGHEPSIGAPVMGLEQRRPDRAGQGPMDMPPWVLPIQRRLDTVIRQQDEILYHLQHPWRVRWQRWHLWWSQWFR